MAGFQTLLVATDFSPHSEAALATAEELGERLGARMHLLHVVHPPAEVLSPYEIHLPVGLAEEMQEAARRKLAPRAEKLRARGLATEIHVASGVASERIPEFAEELGADLVVLGTRGLSGLKHVLLGSVAESVLRRSPCPVLTVRSE